MTNTLMHTRLQRLSDSPIYVITRYSPGDDNFGTRSVREPPKTHRYSSWRTHEVMA